MIELYLLPQIDALQHLRGVHNSQKQHAPRVALRLAPSPDYRQELAAYLAGDRPALLPVEYDAVEWRDRRPAPRPTAEGVGHLDDRLANDPVEFRGRLPTREMVIEHLDERERA